LNAKNKGEFRLPTEAKWEYACRAGTKTAYSFGDTIAPKDANYSASRINKPVPVGSYKPNAFGLYDMHGNVWEWCEDWYREYPKWPVTNPKVSDSGERRVLRGGSFINGARDSRSANRFFNSPIFLDITSEIFLRRYARSANPSDIARGSRYIVVLGFHLARTP